MKGEKKITSSATQALTLWMWSQLSQGDYTGAASTWLRSIRTANQIYLSQQTAPATRR